MRIVVIGSVGKALRPLIQKFLLVVVFVLAVFGAYRLMQGG